jgi:hypothetical protein
VRSAYHIVRQIFADVAHRILLPLRHVLNSNRSGRTGPESAAQRVRAVVKLPNRLVLSEGVPDEIRTTTTLTPSNEQDRCAEIEGSGQKAGL